MLLQIKELETSNLSLTRNDSKSEHESQIIVNPRAHAQSEKYESYTRQSNFPVPEPFEERVVDQMRDVAEGSVNVQGEPHLGYGHVDFEHLVFEDEDYVLDQGNHKELKKITF